jgi:hypothetical protein
LWAGCRSCGVARSIIVGFHPADPGSNPGTSIYTPAKVQKGPTTNFSLMARNDEQKKRRIDFSTTTIEQKEKYDAAIAESGMKKSAFMRMVLDLYIDGSSAENPVEIHKDKEITKLNRELEQLRGAISLKTRANMHINEELMTIRAKVTGNMDQFDISDLTIQVEKLLKQAGSITNKDLLNQIEDPHKIPNVTQKLNEIELALQRNGKIVILDGGMIEWIQ